MTWFMNNMEGVRTMDEAVRIGNTLIQHKMIENMHGKLVAIFPKCPQCISFSFHKRVIFLVYYSACNFPFIESCVLNYIIGGDQFVPSPNAFYQFIVTYPHNVMAVAGYDPNRYDCNIGDHIRKERVGKGIEPRGESYNVPIDCFQTSVCIFDNVHSFFWLLKSEYPQANENWFTACSKLSNII